MLESEMKLKRSGIELFPYLAQRVPETKFKKCLFKGTVAPD
jgi:hypothetical protein